MGHIFVPSESRTYRESTVILNRSVDIWTKLFKKLLTGGQKLASNLRMDLDGELVVFFIFIYLFFIYSWHHIK